MRTMKNVFEGWEFYSSAFDEHTGTIVRLFEEPRHHFYSILEKHPGYRGASGQKIREDWRERFGFREHAFSPVPETIDLKITGYCAHGCPYCYQDSTPDQAHAPFALVERVFDGLDQAPYQMALGGGEPTEHPELPAIL